MGVDSGHLRQITRVPAFPPLVTITRDQERGPESVRDYRFADYFERKALFKRPYLRKEWCIAVLEHPARSEPQGDSRFRFWAPVPELGGRYLRVITLADKVTILNAFPDRGFKP